MKKTTKYYGSWSANNGSSYNYGYEFANLKDAIKTMRNIAQDNVFRNQSGKWSVTNTDGHVIKSGRVFNNYQTNQEGGK